MLADVRNAIFKTVWGASMDVHSDSRTCTTVHLSPAADSQ